MTKSNPAIFYVYVLFDADAIPRYVGKGKGNRWLKHDRAKDPNNRLKNYFIIQTMRALGEVPKIKIRENITEAEAFDLEQLLIKAIGRYPDGPLTNLTDNRNGPSSETIKAWHATRTAEEKRATAQKMEETKRRKYTPEERSEIGRKNALSEGHEVLTERMKAWIAKKTPEELSARGRAAGLASALVRTEEHKAAAIAGLQRYGESLTPEQRQENFRKTGLFKATPEQLSEWGKKGSAKFNNSRTPAERSQATKRSWITRRANQAKRAPK